MQNDEFSLKYTENAEADLKELIADKSKVVARKAVIKSLKLMASNLKHPSLNTHKYDEMERKFLSLMLKTIRLELIEFFGIMGQGKRRLRYF